MEYKGYKITTEQEGVRIEGVKDFHPVHIFECGQCFRWNREADGSYTGVAGGKIVNLVYQEEALVLRNATLDDVKEQWFEYFDLERDYGEIKERLRKDEIMEEAIRFGSGIRLLKQDLWETLISFIISTNNRIPKIKKTVEALSRLYGDDITWNGVKHFTFPETDKLAEPTVEELEVCRGGYRCKYIVHTSCMVKNHTVDLYGITRMNAAKARAELMKLSGVGPKVADCVLLYSGTRQDVFPTDVWVKRVMEALYFKREAGFDEIQRFAADYFGDLAGFAQQYLFYYAREKKIGLGA